MDKIRIPLRYDGVWTTNSGGNVSYEGGKMKGILLLKNASYEELHLAVVRALDINPAKFVVTMMFKCKTCDPIQPMKVTNDSEVEFFVAEVSDVSIRNPLCITVVRKCDWTEGLLVGEEEGANILGLKVGAEKYLGSQIPIELDNTMTEEDVMGFKNYTDHIFAPCGSKPADVCTSPAARTEASVHPMDDSPKWNKLKSEIDEWDWQAPMTALIPQGINGGRTDSVLYNVKDVRASDICSNKDELQLKIRMIVVSRQFNIRVKKSTKDLLVMACVQTGCKWWLRATKLVGSEAFRVHKYISEHTCSLDSLVLHHPQATSKLIGHCIKWKYEGASQSYRPNDIVQYMKKRYGMSCTYDKAWRAREVAMTLARGSPEQSYSVLLLYCAMLEMKNPGTITHIECDSSNRFKYFFMALGGCIGGFRSFIRPIIAVDGTFLKYKYKGTLFIATCMDGNNQVYPLAFGIGDSENDDTWIWFMTKLHGCIGEVYDLVFISDRNTSIATTIVHSFPRVLHGICMYHLGQNMKANCKKTTAFLYKLFYKAAKAYRVSVFNEVMSQIAGVNIKAAEYLILADPTKWARCQFHGRRYSIMTTNIAECLNTILKEARELPIMKLIEHIHGVLQRWFWERHEEAVKMTTSMTRWAEAKLRQRMNKASSYTVRAVDVHMYLVIDEFLNPVVNMENRTCDCKKFQLDQLPCAHALVVYMTHHLSCYDYCASYYSTEALAAAYAASIHPVGPEDEWVWPELVDVPVVLPPEGRKPRGRPATKRKPSKGEGKQQTKCSRCGGFGHNRQKCRALIPVSTSVV